MLMDTDKFGCCKTCVHRGDPASCDDCEDASGYEFEEAVDSVFRLSDILRLPVSEVTS